MEDIREETEKKASIIKVVTISLTIFLLLILIIFLFPGDLIEVIEGQIASTKMKNFEVSFSNGKVIFHEEVYKKLMDYYLENQRTEINACLIGYKSGEDYIATGIYIPRVIDSSVTHVRSEQCPKETIIPIHSHPYKRCIFSEQDIKMYEHFKSVNPNSILGLMCEEDRFSFYKHNLI